MKINTWILLVTILCSSCFNNGNSQSDLKRKSATKAKPVGQITHIENKGKFGLIKHGYKDETGDTLVRAIYSNLPKRPWEMMPVKCGIYSGVINYLGDTLIEFGKYKDLKMDHSLHLSKPSKKNGVQYFSEKTEMNMICNKDNLFGMIDPNERIVIPIVYEKYLYILGEKYAFLKNGIWSIFDVGGNEISKIEADKIGFVFFQEYLLYWKSSKEGLFSLKQNKDILGLQNKINILKGKFLSVRLGDKLAFISLENIKELKFKYDSLEEYSQNKIDESRIQGLNFNPKDIIGLARIDKKDFLIDNQGNEIEIGK